MFRTKKRLSLFAVVGSVVAIAAFAYLSFPVRVAEAQVVSASTLNLEVAVDGSSFTIIETEPGSGIGPFYIEGDIYPEGTLDEDCDPGKVEAIGIFRCWGWLPQAAVSQEYEIFGRGKIQTQGLEVDRRAVVGGTDDFKGVRGEGFFEPFATCGGFTGEFHITPATGGPL
jgi:hypothetical protein